MPPAPRREAATEAASSRKRPRRRRRWVGRSCPPFGIALSRVEYIAVFSRLVRGLCAVDGTEYCRCGQAALSFGALTTNPDLSTRETTGAGWSWSRHPLDGVNFARFVLYISVRYSASSQSCRSFPMVQSPDPPQEGLDIVSLAAHPTSPKEGLVPPRPQYQNGRWYRVAKGTIWTATDCCTPQMQMRHFHQPGGPGLLGAVKPVLQNSGADG